MPTQQTFDFKYLHRQRMLETVKLPPSEVENSRTLLIRMTTLLKTIDSFAGDGRRCFASMEAIAERMRCTVRNVRRVLSVAKRLGLVLQTIRGRTLTAYLDLNWSLIVDWSGESPEFGVTGHYVPSDRTVGSGVTGHYVPSDRTVASPGAIPEPKPNSHIKTKPKAGVFKSGNGGRKGHGTRSKFPKLTAQILASNDSLKQWSEAARNENVIGPAEADLRFVFEAAERALNPENKIENPVGYFRWLIENNKRNHISEPEGDRASERLKDLVDPGRRRPLARCSHQHDDEYDFDPDLYLSQQESLVPT